MMEESRSREIRRSAMLMESMCAHCRDRKKCSESTEREEPSGLPVMECPGFIRQKNKS